MQFQNFLLKFRIKNRIIISLYFFAILKFSDRKMQKKKYFFCCDLVIIYNFLSNRHFFPLFETYFFYSNKSSNLDFLFSVSIFDCNSKRFVSCSVSQFFVSQFFVSQFFVSRFIISQFIIWQFFISQIFISQFFISQFFISQFYNSYWQIVVYFSVLFFGSLHSKLNYYSYCYSY